MARQDSETRLLAAVSAVQAGLNTKLAAISSEKADDVTLDSVQSAGYYFQDFGDRDPTHVPAVYFNAMPSAAGTNAHEAAETMRFVVELVTSDQGHAGSAKLLKLLCRYRRAIREVMLDQCQHFPGLKAEDLPDLPFPSGEGYLYSVAVGFEFNYVP